MSKLVNMRDMPAGRPLVDPLDRNRKTGNGKAAGRSLTAAVKAAEAARDDARVSEDNARKDAASAAESAERARRWMLGAALMFGLGTVMAVVIVVQFLRM